MAFSTRALMTIEAFAGNIGIAAMPAADGSFSFVFDRSGTLTLTCAADGTRTLASLYMRPVRMDEKREQLLLSLAGPDITTRRFLSTGVAPDGAVMFVVGIDDEEMNLPTLEICLQQLRAARAAFN